MLLHCKVCIQILIYLKLLYVTFIFLSILEAIGYDSSRMSPAPVTRIMTRLTHAFVHMLLSKIDSCNVPNVKQSKCCKQPTDVVAW